MTRRSAAAANNPPAAAKIIQAEEDVSDSGSLLKSASKSEDAPKVEPTPVRPLLNGGEAAIIDHLKDIQGLLQSMKKENKSLVEKVNFLTTKVDNQGTELRKQSTEIRQLKNELSARPEAPPLMGITTPRNIPAHVGLRDDAVRNSIPHSQSSNRNDGNDGSGGGGNPTTNIHTSATSGSTLILQQQQNSSLNRTGGGERNSHTTNRNHQPPHIYGSKKVSNNTSSIAGHRTVRDVLFFVGGLSKDMDSNTLGTYIEHSIGITPVKITLNRRNAFNSSFKVVVRSNEKDKLFCADAWEENIIVKPFREQRSQDQQQQRRRQQQQQQQQRQQQQWQQQQPNQHHYHQQQQRYNENENEAPFHNTSIDWEGINQRLYDASLSPNGRRFFY